MSEKEHSIEEIKVELGKIEKGLKTSQDIRTVAKAKEGMYVEEIKKIDKEIKSYGVDPNKGIEELKSMEKEIVDKMISVAKFIPFQMLLDWNKITQADIPNLENL